jgi:hypothetical protein
MVESYGVKIPGSLKWCYVVILCWNPGKMDIEHHQVVLCYIVIFARIPTQIIVKIKVVKMVTF